MFSSCMVKFFSKWIFDYSTLFFVFICVDNLGDALLPCLHQMKEQIFHLVWVFIGLDLSHEQQKNFLLFVVAVMAIWVIKFSRERYKIN